MTFDDLKNQPQSPAPKGAAPEALLANIRQRSARFDREVRLRTLYGAASFLLPIPLILFIFTIVPQPATWLTVAEVGIVSFLLAGAAIVIGHGLRRRQPAASKSVKAFLESQLERVERQARLFRSIKWWFWTPLLAAWAIYAIAMLSGLLPRNLFSLLNLFLVPALAYFGIRYAGRYLEREILPWQKSFSESLRAMTTE